MDNDLLGKELGNGRYQIIGKKPLGKGGFATVYLGLQKKLNRKVAIKVLSPVAAQDEDLVKRFIREARVVAMFDHPNIIKVIDSDSEGDIHYFVMNYLPQTLLQVLSRSENRNGLKPDRWFKIAKDIASALNYIHHQRTVKEFVHRDIKPGNIMFDESDNAILTDFGLVKWEQLSQLTVQSSLIGTPKYMSPEQIKGESLDHRSDLYSFGIVLYEMLVGHPPFSGEPITVCHKQIAEEPSPPHDLKPEVPSVIEAMILKLLAKDINQRYQSAGDLLYDLNANEGITRTFQPSEHPQQDISSTATSDDVFTASSTSSLESAAPSGREATPTVIKSPYSRQTGAFPPTAENSPATNVPTNRYKWLGISSVILMIAGLFVTLWLLKNSPNTGYVRLLSTPPAAQIAINDVTQPFTTPHTFSGEIGDTLNLLLMLSDYQPADTTIVITSSDTVELAIQLDSMSVSVGTAPGSTQRLSAITHQKAPAATAATAIGQIKIETIPIGASVYQNDVLINEKTPCLLTDVPVGTVELRVELDGYVNWHGEMNVQANQIHLLQISLKEQAGLVKITVVPPEISGMIQIEGETNDRGYTPKDIELPVRQQPYRITIKKFGFKTVEGFQEVLVKPDGIHPLTFTLVDTQKTDSP